MGDNMLKIWLILLASVSLAMSEPETKEEKLLRQCVKKGSQNYRKYCMTKGEMAAWACKELKTVHKTYCEGKTKCDVEHAAAESSCREMIVNARDSQSYTDGIITSTSECFETVMNQHWQCASEHKVMRKKSSWVVKKNFAFKMKKAKDDELVIVRPENLAQARAQFEGSQDFGDIGIDGEMIDPLIAGFIK